MSAYQSGLFDDRSLSQIIERDCTQLSTPVPMPLTQVPTVAPDQAPAIPTPTPARLWNAADPSRHPRLHRAIADRGWDRASPSSPSDRAALHLLHLADALGQDRAIAILSMPFLNSVEPPDAAAVHGLQIAARQRPAHTKSFLDNDPAMISGATDDHAPILAVLPTALLSGPDLAHSLMAQAPDNVQTAHIAIPSSPPVTAAVIRSHANRHSPLAMRAAATALQRLIPDSGRPPPTEYFPILFAPTPISTEPGIYNHSHIAIRPDYDVPPEHPSALNASSLIIHELTHYWWNDNETWIDEGMADALATIVLDLPSPPKPPCTDFSSISDLRAADPAKTDPSFVCHYSLGSRLFIDLHRHLAGSQFRDGYRRLLTHANATTASVQHVRDAFPSALHIISLEDRSIGYMVPPRTRGWFYPGRGSNSGPRFAPRKRGYVKKPARQRRFFLLMVVPTLRPRFADENVLLDVMHLLCEPIPLTKDGRDRPHGTKEPVLTLSLSSVPARRHPELDLRSLLAVDFSSIDAVCTN